MKQSAMSRPIEILLVDDNVGHVELTREAFKESKLHNKLNVVQDGTGLGSDVNCTKATDNRTVAIFEGQGIGSSQAAGGQYVSITRTGPISNASANVCGGLLLANGSSVTGQANCGIRGTYEYNSGRDIQFFTSFDL